jgi:hypothetical protein
VAVTVEGRPEDPDDLEGGAASRKLSAPSESESDCAGLRLGARQPLCLKEKAPGRPTENSLSAPLQQRQVLFRAYFAYAPASGCYSSRRDPAGSRLCTVASTALLTRMSALHIDLTGSKLSRHWPSNRDSDHPSCSSWPGRAHPRRRNSSRAGLRGTPALVGLPHRPPFSPMSAPADASPPQLSFDSQGRQLARSPKRHCQCIPRAGGGIRLVAAT